MSVSMKSLQGRAPSSEMGEQLFTEVAIFRGKPVAVRKIRKSCIGLTKDDLREMNMVGWFGIVWFKVEFWKLMFPLIYTWTNSWANNADVSDFRHHRAHRDATVMVVRHCFVVNHINACVIYKHGKSGRWSFGIGYNTNYKLSLLNILTECSISFTCVLDAWLNPRELEPLHWSMYWASTNLCCHELLFQGKPTGRNPGVHI